MFFPSFTAAIGATVSILAPVANSVLTGLSTGFSGLSSMFAGTKLGTGFSITSTALKGANDIVVDSAAILTGETSLAQGAFDITTTAFNMAKDIVADALTVYPDVEIVGTQPDLIG